MENDKVDSSIDRKLDILINLIGYRIAKELDLSVTETSPVLRRLGLSPKEIANILNSTPHAVSVQINKAKKRKKKAKKKAR